MFLSPTICQIRFCADVQGQNEQMVCWHTGGGSIQLGQKDAQSGMAITGTRGSSVNRSSSIDWMTALM